MGGLHAAIDPFLGTDGGGNCLPGPYLPFGLVRLGPDVVPPHGTHGYAGSGPIARFTHTHVSGTGGLGRYGNIGLMPYRPQEGRARPREREGERAWAGGYAVRLEGIEVELTATPHVGVHRWRFPDPQGAVELDLAAVITTGYLGPELDPNGVPPEVLSTHFERHGAGGLGGNVTIRGGWGHDAPYTVYFYARFDPPPTGVRAGENPDILRLEFGSATVEARVGISFASVDRAVRSVAEEAENSFDAIAARSEEGWEAALRGFSVTGGIADSRTLFATSLYRLLCMPSDLGVRHEFTAWETDRRHFSDYYCLWDSCRNANAYLAWFRPADHADMVHCLLDIGEQMGWCPDAWIAGSSAFLQGGNSVEVLLAEAAAKRLPGIDLALAWDVVWRQRQTASPDPYRFGRFPEDGAHPYLPAGVPQCVSRTLEYRFQDACLATLAEAVGAHPEANALHARASDVWESWHPEWKAFAPRDRSGAWATPFHPDQCRWDSWNDPWCYEGSSRQWSWNVQHDVPGLIRRYGGAEPFTAAVQTFLSGAPPALTPLENHVVSARYHPKETMLHVPYLLSEAGRPDLASEAVHAIRRRFYRTTRDGLPDNEDMGCQSGFLIGSLIGIYPAMGEDRYWLTAPAFREATVVPLGGEALEVSAPDADESNVFLRGAVLNGRRLADPWVRHADLRGRLEMEVSSEPGPWRV